MSRVGPMLSRNDSLHSGLNPIRGGTPSESHPQINILAKLAKACSIKLGG